MSKSTKFFGEWEKFNGRKVKIEGRAYRIRATVSTAIYPYEDEVISVHAEPINKRSKYYLKTKAELGDDWSTDVLESSIELICDIWTQLTGDPVHPKNYRAIA
jgi:hypothetical protein